MERNHSPLVRFKGEWVETSKCWKWRSYSKVTIPIPVRRNSSYEKFIARVMQSGDLDCAPSDVVISYVIYSREKVNPTIINSDDRNSSTLLLRHPTVDDDLIDDDLNNYENDVDDIINIEDYSMHMEDFSSDSQDDEEDRETES
ncbi:hypothetical protein BC332_30532 [Capsicum chinense]|nr:hypothetical protein BC332_30532 [Capsicum chinense]